MSNVRVTYSGLIAFVISIGSVFTGLIFTLIVTRQLTQIEFGMWSLIGGLTAYVFVVQPIIGYWVTREIARDQESGKTALVSNNIFMTIGVIIYVIIVYVVGSQSDADLNILLFAAILIPVNFLQSIISSIGMGFKPHVVQYGFLVFELSKISPLRAQPCKYPCLATFLLRSPTPGFTEHRRPLALSPFWRF